jgi:hypothetical protein
VRRFEGITRNRVPWVKEVGEREQLDASPGTAIVDAIEW